MDRNVVVLCLDSVRKDYFDAHAERVREAAELSYAGCRAASSWSSPSHASMFTGKFPSEHGVHAHHKDFSGVDRSDTFLADLPQHRAIGVSANVFASSRFGFDRWFDDFREVSTGCRYTEGLDPNRAYVESDADGPRVFLEYLRDAVAHDHPVKSLANGVLAGVNVATRNAPVPKLLDDGANIIVRDLVDAIEEADGPFFAFANFGDAHVPLRPVYGYDRDLFDAPDDWTTDRATPWEVIGSPETHEEYLRHHRDLYAAAVDYLDRRVMAFVERVDRVTDRETTVIVTADHGENLGTPADEGLVGHKSSLSEALLHVPLAVLNPPSHGAEGPAGTVREGFVSHLDLGRLVAGFAKGEVPDVTRERVAAEVIGMSPGPDPPEDHEYWDRMLRCAYEKTTKYVWDSLGARERYAIDPDRPCWQERVGEGVEIPEWARAFFAEDIETVKRRAQSDATRTDLDADTKRRLDDLGYL